MMHTTGPQDPKSTLRIIETSYRQRRWLMKVGDSIIEAGAVCFALQYRPLMADQGVSLQVVGEVEGEKKELLRFDCFDQRPHYHYDPAGKNVRFDIDKTTAGNPITWTVKRL